MFGLKVENKGNAEIAGQPQNSRKVVSVHYDFISPPNGKTVTLNGEENAYLFTF